MEALLTQMSNNGFCLTIDNKLDNETLTLWRRLLTDIALIVSVNKSVWLITIDPVKNSIAHEYEGMKVTYSTKTYFISKLPSFKAVDVINLTESSDWLLGLTVILFSQIEAIDNLNVSELFPKTDNEIAAIKSTVLFCTNDGYSLYGLNFDFPYSEIINRIKEIASKYLLIIDVK